MKAIMYHYVRTAHDSLPYFRYLDEGNFRCQLDWFAERYPFVARDEFFQCLEEGRNCEGIVLTFDDAFSDHYEFVYPELKRRGLWGIFFVPTAMYSQAKLLDVHRIHLILGRYGGVRAMDLLNRHVTDDMLSHGHVEEFHTKTYTRQDNDSATMLFKRTLNYYISYDYRQQVLDVLMAEYLTDEHEGDLVSRYYMRPSQLKEMRHDGMEIGSHGMNHLVMSKLDMAAQESEIVESFKFLGDAVGAKVRTFCYPYGGFHTFTEETEGLLTRCGSLCAFNVEPRDVGLGDIVDRPQALPRYDCNQFPFGQSHCGEIPPEESVASAAGAAASI
jgi:peptidoglycan/xylan/chitin deacetylase (PgdA/CDA1 family)